MSPLIFTFNCEINLSHEEFSFKMAQIDLLIPDKLENF